MTTPTLVAPIESIHAHDFADVALLVEATEPECECQDVERCPVHFGYDD
jgi:hypothetical protein